MIDEVNILINILRKNHLIYYTLILYMYNFINKLLFKIK